LRMNGRGSTPSFAASAPSSALKSIHKLLVLKNL
jgi:hypothetical protein